MQMATKYQTELTLKALLTELHRSGQDLYALVDDAIMQMHKRKLFVKEDSTAERCGAEDPLFTYVEQLAGSRPDIKPGNIEDF